MNQKSISEKIKTELIQSNIDRRYSIDAYLFILRGLDFHQIRTGEKRHFTGAELTFALIEFADKQFGSLTELLLSRWGITRSIDFGNLVYNLIKIGILTKTENDTIEDFKDVMDFKTYFNKRKYFEITPAVRSTIIE